MQLPGRVIQIYLRCCSIKVSEFFFSSKHLLVCMGGAGLDSASTSLAFVTKNRCVQTEKCIQEHV